MRRRPIRQVLLSLSVFDPFVIRFGGTDTLELLQHFRVGVLLGFFYNSRGRRTSCISAHLYENPSDKPLADVFLLSKSVTVGSSNARRDGGVIQHCNNDNNKRSDTDRYHRCWRT
ncbi:hypothetical protein HCH54_008343 [Aspergillus fumigatus]